MAPASPPPSAESQLYPPVIAADEEPPPDFGRLAGWKKGDRKRVWRPGTYSEYEILTDPVMSREGIHSAYYVEVSFLVGYAKHRLYEWEVRDRVDVIPPDDAK